MLLLLLEVAAVPEARVNCILSAFDYLYTAKQLLLGLKKSLFKNAVRDEIAAVLDVLHSVEHELDGAVGHALSDDAGHAKVEL